MVIRYSREGLDQIMLSLPRCEAPYVPYHYMIMRNTQVAPDRDTTEIRTEGVRVDAVVNHSDARLQRSRQLSGYRSSIDNYLIRQPTRGEAKGATVNSKGPLRNEILHMPHARDLQLPRG